MKKSTIKFLLLATILVSIISCKKEDDNSGNGDFKAENRRALGVSASNILSSDIYDKLTVEFVYATGFRPQEETISSFRTFLEDRINKPGGITFVETVIDAPTNAPFDAEKIRIIEDENRKKYTDGSNLAVYVFFANGNSTNDTNASVTLGNAYQNTSIAIFEKTLMDLADRTLAPMAALRFLESNTLQHEFGHILGLVNIQNDDIHPTDHEDSAHIKHCVIEECLMYFESRNPSFIMERMAERRNTPVFDDLCLADLRAKGGK